MCQWSIFFHKISILNIYWFKDKEKIYIIIDEKKKKKLLASENGKIYEAGSSVKEINDKKIRITLSDGKYDIKILND